jgi:hypothetical protein
MRRHRSLLWLAAWAFVFPVFYLFYSNTPNDWWGLRFVMPAFPPIVVASLVVAQSLGTRFRLRFRTWWLAPAAFAVIVHGALWGRHLHAFTVGRGERVYPETAAWLREHAPANSVVAAKQTSGALFYYTKFPIVRWDAISPDDFNRITTTCAATGHTAYATLFPFERDSAQWAEICRRPTGRWTQVGSVHHVSIWRLEP